MSLKELLSEFRTCSTSAQDAIIALIDWMGEDEFIRWIQKDDTNIDKIGTTALLHAWNCIKY